MNAQQDADLSARKNMEEHLHRYFAEAWEIPHDWSPSRIDNGTSSLQYWVSWTMYHQPPITWHTLRRVLDRYAFGASGDRRPTLKTIKRLYETEADGVSGVVGGLFRAGAHCGHCPIGKQHTFQAPIIQRSRYGEWYPAPRSRVGGPQSSKYHATAIASVACTMTHDGKYLDPCPACKDNPVYARLFAGMCELNECWLWQTACRTGVDIETARRNRDEEKARLIQAGKDREAELAMETTRKEPEFKSVSDGVDDALAEIARRRDARGEGM